MSKRKSKHEYEPGTLPAKRVEAKHWALGLKTTMEDPDYIVKSDDLVTIVRDKYPKAEIHYLVLPKEEISSLKAVTVAHIPLLKHMKKFVEDLIKERHKDKKFKLGYHSEASMHHLHLHALSDDMNSACVKTKKHWNSFNTDFFISFEEVIKSLEENGNVLLKPKDVCKELIDSPLKCHKCEYVPKHMPDLKKHILKHMEP